MISVVCPFYNEEDILEASVRLMLQNLAALPEDWELIIVNDGSRDRSLEIARNLSSENPRLHVLSYTPNRGRGYAIRTGIAAASGEIVVTTEIDSSWGDDIVARIVEEFKSKPDADMIIASPHLKGGGYKNVPRLRVFLSSVGNYIIRTGLTYKITMNTGMTRGYKRDKFLQLPLYEDEKEQHLEIIIKALAFNYRIYEIPAVLEWKAHKLSSGQTTKKRKSSANITKLIRTHLIFSLFAAPFRYMYAFGVLLLLPAAFLMGYAVINLFTLAPSIYLALTSFFLILFSFLIFVLGILGQQNRTLLQEMWRVESQLEQLNRPDQERER
ncbi:MAG: glycosyltransferase family 2 protein [Anaerolineae bacterium]|nr:glycosyltransferase family 2 protein [Anaerolineae bacterium]